MGVSAGVLLLISLSGWLHHRAQLADIVADHLRLQITGPARLRPAMASEYSILTTSVTGKPVSAQIDFALHSPDGKPVMLYNEKTDENGRLKVTIPADPAVSVGAKLEVSASRGQRREEVVTRFSVEPVHYATHLALDKPLYRPGETVRYRCLTLLRLALTPDREMQLRCEILDPGQAPVPGSQWEGVTRHGIAVGEFPIPEGLVGGQYTLVARSLRGEFPAERRKFFIRRYRLPRLLMELKFLRNSYGPGDTVTADFSAAVGARLKILATVDGQLVHEATAEASGLGTFHVEFALPERIEQGDAQLAVVADDGAARETIARRIPLQLDEVEVRFYPEGGDLVAGLENHVYFTARNSLGEPVDVRGRILDSQGQHVASVASTYEGMGTFTLVPSPGKEYRLVLPGVAGAPQTAELPVASTSRRVVLSMGLGVFPDGKPLEFNVRASEAGVPLVASAWCRGVPVGQQVFVATEKVKANSVAVPLDDDASGVIRLTIYDYSSSLPEPVAERLVYRQPARRLDVEIDETTHRDAPGGQAEMSLSVADENGSPVPATLGVSAVNEALLNLAVDDVPSMPAHFLLATEVESSDDLQHADFYLSQSREAAVALDLLLGTQGWRRFLEQRLQGSGEQSRQEQLLRLVALGGKANPPAVFDNLSELQERYQKSLDTYRASRTRTSNTLTTLSFFGGAGLVMLVAMLQVLNIATGARLWAPAIVVATVCLIIGGILMDPGRWNSPPEGAVAFTPFDLAPDTLSPALDVPEAPEDLEEAKRRGELDEREDDADKTVPGVTRTDAEGRARIRFDSSGPAAGFRVLVDAHADGGRIGSGQGEFVGQLPFLLEPRVPQEVSPGDRIDVPLGLVNGTDDKLPVELTLDHGEQVRLDGDPRRSLQLEARQRVRQFFSLDVVGQGGDCALTFRGTAAGTAGAPCAAWSPGTDRAPCEAWSVGPLADEATCSLKVVPVASVESPSDSVPADNQSCPVRLSTRLSENSVRWGETVVLTAQLVNTARSSQPLCVVRLGLPAGLEFRPDQLERLKKAGKIDYYQTLAREVICYWRTLAPEEKVDLKLDLIAAVPGKFTGPTSLAYLHDTPGEKHQNEPLVVEITAD